MIPKLTVNNDFLNTINEEERQWWEKMAEPVIVFEYDDIHIYNNQADTFVGEDWLFDEYKKASIDFYGYCPSEESLKNIILPLKETETNYMVTARLVEKYVADCDDGYGCYYNEDGECTDMSYPDYVDEYGHPTTQYEGYVVRFTVYILIENNYAKSRLL